MTSEAVLTIACASQVLARGQTDHAPCTDHGLSDQSHGITIGTMTAFWQRADSITACSLPTDPVCSNAIRRSLTSGYCLCRDEFEFV